MEFQLESSVLSYIVIFKIFIAFKSLKCGSIDSTIGRNK